MAFDPYHVWLGIPPAEQPPNHYRLLGLAPFEGNPGVIDHAAERVLLHLRSVAAGPNGAQSQQLIGDVMRARICLLDGGAKATYDAALQSKLAAASVAARLPPSATPTQPLVAPIAPAPVVARPAPRPVVARSIATTPIPATPIVKAQPLPAAKAGPPPLPAAAAQPAAAPPTPPPTFEVAPAASHSAVPRSSASRRNSAKEGESVPMAAIGLVKIVLGALGGLSMAVLIVWVGFRADPLGLFQSSGGKGQAKKPSNTVVQTVQQPSVQPRVVHTPQSSPTPSDPRNTTQEQSAPHTSESPAEKVVTPSQPPPPMVVTPMPATPEPPQPASPVVAAQRRPPPTADEQAAKLAELKEVYDKEFEGANRPGTREVFPDFLIDTSEKLKSDPVARFVLLREAFTRLIAQKEFTLAAEVVDRLDREFDMDPFSLRTHTLTKASESAKLPAEKLASVLCSADLAEAALAQQRIA